VCSFIEWKMLRDLLTLQARLRHHKVFLAGSRLMDLLDLICQVYAILSYKDCLAFFSERFLLPLIHFH